MPLSSGSRLGLYEILQPLGAGGMGQVYRARDTRLDREVAIKVLPDLFATDRDRVARFEREARTLAALNHPHIAQVHGVLEQPLALILELVEGEDLAQRLGRGRIPLDQSVAIARQIAEALEAAHERGIIHRDLKPANIKVTDEGTVKVLDFGLAKVLDAGSGTAADLTSSPTFTSPPVTQLGVVLGTAAYMSPEQAKGKAVDKRADIWAFGAVLFEMLTGRPIFSGETANELLSAVIMTEPDLGMLPSGTPPPLRHLLRRCLEKDPRQRLRDIGEARVALSDPSLLTAPPVAAPVAGSGSSRPRLIAAGVLIAAAAAAGGYLLATRRTSEAPSRALQTSFTQLTEQPGLERQPTIAPDGKTVVYVSTARGNSDLYLLRVGGRKPVLLTEDSDVDDYAPAFSPEGDRIAFRSERSGGGIFVMEPTGESVRRITDFGFDPRWSPDGKSLVVADERIVDPMSRAIDSQLWVVSVSDGSKRRVAKGDAVGGQWSPHQRRIVYWGLSRESARDIATVAADGSQAEAPVWLTSDAAVDWSPTWSPDGRYIYFASSRGGTLNLWRIAVDEGSGRALAAPEPVTTPTAWSGHFEFTGDGKQLVFADQDQSSSVWSVKFDPVTGAPVGQPSQVMQGRAINSIDLSPDGRTIVFSQRGQPWEALGTVRLDGSGWSRLTDDSAYHRLPSWSPDGTRLLFFMNREPTRLWTLRADGSGLTPVPLSKEHSRSMYPVWSPDGSLIAAGTDQGVVVIDPSSSPARTVVHFPDPDRSPAQLTPFSWSPDGQWIAGTLQHGIRDELVLLAMKTRASRVVARDAASPAWLPDSRRLLFAGPTHLMLVDMKTGVEQRVMALTRQIDQWGRTLSLSRDGRTLVYLQTRTEGDIWLMKID